MINAANINVLNHSNLVWKSLKLESNYNDLELSQQNITFANGAVFINAAALTDVKDIKINQDSLVVLGNAKSATQLFNEQQKSIEPKKEVFHSALYMEDTNVTVGTTQFLQTQNTTLQLPQSYNNKPYKLRYLTTANNKFQFIETLKAGDLEIFKFTFENDFVYINNTNNLFFTSQSAPNRKDFVYLASKIPNSNLQKFNYILTDAGITLFKYNSNYTRALSFDMFTNHIEYVNITNLNNLPDKTVLFIDNFREKLNSNSIKNSFFVKYDIKELDKANTLEIDNSSYNLTLSQDYLLTIPFINSSNIYKSYISSLKNFQTPAGEYCLIDNNTKRREYTTLFTGANQKNGYDNIYLNYKSNTIEKKFSEDIETIFHYPPTANATPLSSAGLIEDGAIASHNPFSADRIYYSNRDYRNFDIQTNNASIVDNTWRCAWLSGNSVGDSVWMDREYSGAYFLEPVDISLIQLDTSSPLIIDKPSEMVLQPNHIYKYFRQGQKNIKQYIDMFKEIDSDHSTKILEISSWDSNTLTDTSVYKNNGTIINSDTADLNKDYINLYSTNYVLFPHSSSLFEDKEMTVGVWYKVNDWAQSKGAQIFGNFADGGIGLFNIQKENTFNIILTDTSSGEVFDYSEEFAIKNKQKLFVPNDNLIFTVRLLNKNFWLIDSTNLTATQYDINNNKLNTIYFSNLKQIKQVETDIAENIYVVDSVTRTVIRFDGYEGGINKTINLPEYITRIEVVHNYNGTLIPILYDYQTNISIIGVSGLTSTTDIYNNVWSAIGVNLYKNDYMYASIYDIREITSDSEGNIWILHENKLTKLNAKTNVYEFTKTLFTNNNIKNSNFVNILHNKKYQTFFVCIDSVNEKLFIVDSVGEIFKTIEINKFTNGYGDYTSYQSQRKFYSTYQFMWKVYVTESSGTGPTTSGVVCTIPFNIPSVDNDWHYYNFTFSSSKGIAAIYVDGYLVKNINFNSTRTHPFRYKIKHSSKSYTIGVSTSKRGVNNSRNIGSVARLHIYKYAFLERDIKKMYFSTYKNYLTPLVWNIGVGSRNYIEQIDKFFMHKMPGSKSKFFNLKIKNFNLTALQKSLIEQSIRDIMSKITPADTTLNTIVWM